jgi:hypothetical protein
VQTAARDYSSLRGACQELQRRPARPDPNTVAWNSAQRSQEGPYEYDGLCSRDRRTGYDGVHNFSESVLKLDPTHGLNLVDWFTPSNWSTLDNHDLDLMSSDPTLVPGTSLLVA